MTDRPLTYEQVWDQLSEGRLSVTVLCHLMRNDEVFRKWCERRAEAERKARDIKPDIRISDKDMA